MSKKNEQWERPYTALLSTPFSELLNIPEPAHKREWFISTDTYDKYISVYILFHRVGENITEVYSKKLRDKDVFDKEVEQLASIFNATTLTSQ